MSVNGLYMKIYHSLFYKSFHLGDISSAISDISSAVSDISSAVSDISSAVDNN